MKAGFAQTDITPRLGVQLTGYGPYRNRAAQKITAPLAARAMAISHGRERAILVNLELCGTPRPLAARIRSAVAARTGCRERDVFISSTHTHSGPAVGGMLGWGEADAIYVETLPARIAGAAALRSSDHTLPARRATDCGGRLLQRAARCCLCPQTLDPRLRPQAHRRARTHLRVARSD
ncbi:MAG: hypothetical protein ACREIA_01705 [Opitutaceae bacterium]